jgi:ATP-dependent DNA helicase RecQ
MAFLRRNDQWIEPHRDWPTDALAAYGWQGRIPAGLQAQRGRALCRWGDDGWGNLVWEGKRRGSRDPSVLTTLLAMVQQLFTGRYPTAFDEQLVAAMVALVRDRWRPTPSPTWVTCVPSLKHSNTGAPARPAHCAGAAPTLRSLRA